MPLTESPSSTNPSAPRPLLTRLPAGLQRIAAISTSLVGTYAATAVLGLAFWTLAARQYSVDAVGVAGTAVAAMGLLSSLGTVGLGTLLIARLPKHEQGGRRVLVRTSLAVAAGAAFALAVVVPLVGIHLFGMRGLTVFAGDPADAVVFAVGTALMSIALVLDQAVLVLGSGRLQLERNVVASAAKLVALVLLVLLGTQSGMAIFAAWALGTLVSLPLVAHRTRGGRELSTNRRFVDLSVMRGLGRHAAGHHALNTTLQAPLQLLPLVVTIALTTADTGVFSAALQITGIVFALPYAVCVGLFAAAEGDASAVLHRMRFTLPFSFGVSILANALLFPLAPFVLSVFGSVYSDQGVAVLRLLTLAGLAFVVKDHYVALRRVQDRTGAATRVLLGFTVVEVGAAWWGAREAGLSGLVGAWLAVLLLECLVLAVPLAVAARSLGGPQSASAPTGPSAGAAPPLASSDAELAASGGSLLLAHDRPSGDVQHVEGTQVQVRNTVTSPASADRGSAGSVAATRGHNPVRRRADGPASTGTAFVGLLLVIMAAALLLTATAAARGRADDLGALTQALWLGGLAGIFAAALIGALFPGMSRSHRVTVVVAAFTLLQVNRVVLYPTAFMFHDEFIHANVLRHILSTGELFTPNTMLPVTAYYPGLEVATSAVQSVTGLSSHTSAVVLLIVVRVALALALVRLVEVLTKSPQLACTAAVLYACNPQFLFFNSQFSYQTLALPLAVVTLLLVLERRRDRWWGLVPALLAQVAVSFTHHVTSGLLVAGLALWGVVECVRRGPTREARTLLLLAFTGLAFTALTLLVPGNSVASYLNSIADSSSSSLGSLLGGGQAKPLFQNSAGSQSTLLERALLVLMVVITLGALLPALWRARGWWLSEPSLTVALAVVALLYPIIPGGHLTVATAEVGDRASGFVYLGVALVVGAWLLTRGMSGRAVAVMAGTATVAFLGGVVFGAGSVARQLPGPFEVSADARSVDEYNLAAAVWMAANLPPESRVYADRTGSLLAGPVGQMQPIKHISSGVDASSLLLAPEFTQDDVERARAAGIQYLVADRRDAFGLPNQDVYVENGEYGQQGRTEPPPVQALTKFDDVPGAERIYDNGFISIYDLQGVPGVR